MWGAMHQTHDDGGMLPSLRARRQVYDQPGALRPETMAEEGRLTPAGGARKRFGSPPRSDRVIEGLSPKSRRYEGLSPKVHQYEDQRPPVYENETKQLAKVTLTEMRRDLEEVAASARETRERLRAALNSQREELESRARTEREETRRELRLELNNKVLEAETQLRRVLETQHEKGSTVAAQVAELRALVTALREEANRNERSRKARESQVLQDAKLAVDAARGAAEGVGLEASEKIQVALKTVQHLATDLEAMRRSQASVNARLDGELEASRRAVARCAEAVGRADAVAATVEDTTLERLRTELRTLEQRFAAELARNRVEIRDEKSFRERLADDVQRGLRRTTELTDDRLSHCERLVSKLGATLSSQENQSTKEPTLAPDGKLTDISGRRRKRKQQQALLLPPTKDGDHINPDSMTAEEVEARLGRKLSALVNISSEAQTQAHIRLRSDHECLEAKLDAETLARKKLETGVADTIQAAVKSVARATKKEVAEVQSRVSLLERSVNDSGNITSLEKRLNEIRQILDEDEGEWDRATAALQKQVESIRTSAHDSIDAERRDREDAISEATTTLQLELQDHRNQCAEALQARDCRTNQRISTELEDQCHNTAILITAHSLVEAVALRVDAEEAAVSVVHGAAIENNVTLAQQLKELTISTAKTNAETIDTLRKEHKVALEKTLQRLDSQAVAARALQTAKLRTELVQEAKLAQDQNDKKSIGQAQLQSIITPVVLKLEALTSRLDQQEKDIKGVRKDLNTAIQLIRVSTSRQLDRQQALAACTRTQLVNGLRHLVKSTSTYATQHIDAANEPIITAVEDHTVKLDSINTRLQVRLHSLFNSIWFSQAIENASSSDAWGESIRAAASALATVSGGLAAVPAQDNSSDSTTGLAKARPLLDSHVRSVFPI